MIKGFDGSYKKYDNLFDDVIEIGYADGSYETYSAGILDKRFQSDGSYEKYNREGAVIRRGLADGSYTEYFDNGSVAAEANSNGDVVSYDENGQVIEKVFNSNDRDSKIVEKYVDGNLNYRWDKDSHKYYDSDGNLVAVSKDDEFTIYNKDGTSNVYDDSKVKCMIGDDGYNMEIDFGDGESRHINANNDYVYNHNTGESVYNQGMGQTVGHYRVSSNEDMANILTSAGINCSIDKLPNNSYAYVNYNNGEVSSVQVIKSGGTSRYSTGDRLTSFITNYEVLPNGSIEKTTIYFDLKDSVKSYQPKDLWNNPDQYIENVIDTVKETL